MPTLLDLLTEQLSTNNTHALASSSLAAMHLKTLQMQSDDSKRQLYGKGQESSVLDVNAGYIHCINNQYNTERLARLPIENWLFRYKFFSIIKAFKNIYNRYPFTLT